MVTSFSLSCGSSCPSIIIFAKEGPGSSPGVLQQLPLRSSARRVPRGERAAKARTSVGLETMSQDVCHYNPALCDGTFTGTNIDLGHEGKVGITGTLPTELGLLTQVVDVTLDGNAFSGTIPTQFGKLTNVAH